MIALGALLGIAASAQAAPAQPGPEPAPMQCDIGPLHQTYGGNRWVVYSCIDNSTVVVAADRGNPAQPFYFILHPRDGGYHIYGEGTGSQEASAAAMKELRALSPAAIVALILETNAAR